MANLLVTVITVAFNSEKTIAKTIEAVLNTYKPYYTAHCRENTRPYDGILEALAELGKDYPLGILSNKPDAAVKELCGEHFPGVYALGETPGIPRTRYFVTFHKRDGNRIEMEVPGEDYGLAADGDEGVLVYSKGDEFIVFKRT